MKRHLLPLAMGGLGIGTTEFVIMGLLPDVSASLQVSIPKAGYLISAYALGVVIGAPLLVALFARRNLKKLLIFLMVLFTVFNAFSAVAPGFYSLLFARFFSGLPHGAFFGIGAVVASRLATEGKQARAIAAMFSGLTFANLAMVPLVTYLGHQLSWRYAFVVVALIGAATIYFLKRLLPQVENTRSVTLAEEMRFFKTRKAWLILLITAIGFGGLFAWFSYIAPLMIHVSGFSPVSVSYIMLLAGLGMVAGNFIGGILADRMPAEKASLVLFTLLIVALILIFTLSGNPYISLLLTFSCGLLSMAVASPINILMIRSAGKSEMMAAAFMQAAFNVANSIGAYFGGLPLQNGLGFNYPALVGAVMASAGLILSGIFILKYSRPEKQKQQESPLAVAETCCTV